LTGEEEKAKAGSNLYPFRKWPLTEDKAERYWTPDRAWDTQAFGYAYPETAGGKAGDQVRNEFARKYGWSRRLDVNQDFGPPPADMLPLDLSKAQVFDYQSDDSPGDIWKPLIPPSFQNRTEEEVLVAVTTASKISQEWYIDVVVER
jgi:hypothetical protein